MLELNQHKQTLINILQIIDARQSGVMALFATHFCVAWEPRNAQSLVDEQEHLNSFQQSLTQVYCAVSRLMNVTESFDGYHIQKSHSIDTDEAIIRFSFLRLIIAKCLMINRTSFQTFFYYFFFLFLFASINSHGKSLEKRRKSENRFREKKFSNSPSMLKSRLEIRDRREEVKWRKKICWKKRRLRKES